MTVWERRGVNERRTKGVERDRGTQEGEEKKEGEERGWLPLDWAVTTVKSEMKNDLADATTPRAALKRC
jgi:hypothetical protein